MLGINMFKTLCLIFMLIPIPIMAQTSSTTPGYYEWGGSSALLSPASTATHYADLKFHNIISGGHDDVVSFTLTLNELTVTVTVEHQYGNIPDRHIIQVSDGFYAEITDVNVADNSDLTIKIYELEALTS